MGLLALVTIVAGCGTRLPVVGSYVPEAPSEGYALVCVFQTYVLPVDMFTIVDNGRVMGQTNKRSHFCYQAEPGWHFIESQAYGSSCSRILMQLEVSRRYAFWNVSPGATINGPSGLCHAPTKVEPVCEELIAYAPWSIAEPELRQLPRVRAEPGVAMGNRERPPIVPQTPPDNRGVCDELGPVERYWSEGLLVVPGTAAR